MALTQITLYAADFTPGPGPKALYGDRPASRATGWVFSVGDYDDQVVYEDMDQAACAGRRHALALGVADFAVYAPGRDGKLYCYAKPEDFR